MLCLSLKPHEAVVITLPDGTRCRVFLANVRGNKVRLGFEFPMSITINRGEVQDRIDDAEVRSKKQKQEVASGEGR
jgi:carbon storage regulator CsrA